jgi:hypothetical protein
LEVASGIGGDHHGEEITMATFQLALSAEERALLISLLETAQKETRIEEHRTRAPDYREHVVHQGDMITGLLRKLHEMQL